MCCRAGFFFSVMGWFERGRLVIERTTRSLEDALEDAKSAAAFP
jgi:hypothetical protein